MKTEPAPRKNHGGTALKDEQSLMSTDELPNVIAAEHLLRPLPLGRAMRAYM